MFSACVIRYKTGAGHAAAETNRKSMTEERPYLVSTEDGSPTIFDPEYGQAMHTMSGAYTESLVKHVNPSRVLEKNRNEIRVLDVGFGLGYNVLALLHEARRRNFSGAITVYSLERDRSFREFIETVSFNDSRDIDYEMVKQAFLTGTARSDNIIINVLTGDARGSVLSIRRNGFDAVFQDAFSPSKNPELWTVEFFSELHRLMDDTAILTTYSSAVQVRAAITEAGFLVGKAPSMGMKREGTLASKSGVIDVIPEDEMKEILSDRKAVPYRDPGMTGTREAITERRRLEMKDRR